MTNTTKLTPIVLITLASATFFLLPLTCFADTLRDLGEIATPGEIPKWDGEQWRTAHDNEGIYMETINDMLEAHYARVYGDSQMLPLQNLIQALQHRDVTLSANGGVWAEAYSSAAGRKGSVDAARSDAIFIDDKYVPMKFTPLASSGTTHDPHSFTSPQNAFDFNGGTTATRSQMWGNVDWVLGKTFSNTNIAYVRTMVSARFSHNTSSFSSTAHLHLQSYNGSTWVTERTLVSDSRTSDIQQQWGYTVAYNGGVVLGKEVSGLRVLWSLSGSHQFVYAYATIIDYGSDSLIADICHNIPSKIFPGNVSSVVGTALFANWEPGASVQYKLENDTEDSGWLEINKLETFTPFTSEPTRCIVRLIPSGTAGYPSIHGFAVTSPQRLDNTPSE